MPKSWEEYLNENNEARCVVRVHDLCIAKYNEAFLRLTSSDGEEGSNLLEALGHSAWQKHSSTVSGELTDQGYMEFSWGDYRLMLYSLKPEYTHALCIIYEADESIVGLQYDSLFTRNVAGVYKVGGNGVILACNEAFARLLGYDRPEEIVGHDGSEFYLFPGKRKDFLDEIKRKKVLTSYEIELKKKDGTECTCLENAFLEKNEEGHDIILGTLIDISEKKKIEGALRESEERFRALSNVTLEAVAFVSQNVIIDCNEQFALLFALKSRTDAIAKRITDFISAADLRRIGASLDRQHTRKIEVRCVNRNGEWMYLEVSGGFVDYHGIRTKALLFYDITARKRAEFALEQSALRFRNLLENSPNGVFILTDGLVKYVNNAGLNMLGCTDEDELYDKKFSQFIGKEHRKQIAEDFKNIREGEEATYREVQVIEKRGNVVDVGIKAALTVYENKPSIQVTVDNLSTRMQLLREQYRLRAAEEMNEELKQQIEERKQSQAKLESIFNSTENLMMWTMNHKCCITTLNENFHESMKGHFGVEVKRGTNIKAVLNNLLDPNHNQGQLEAMDQALKGRPQQFEFALLDKEKRTVWMLAFVNPVYIDDRLEEVSCLVYDNTERKQIDRRIRESLKEKEVLLQEVHHRVKNNLQVISSILNLQSGYVNDERTRELLMESQQRIKSMSFIHETLYRTADFSSIDFRGYLQALSSNLFQSYKTGSAEVKLVTRLDPVHLSIDQSMPCGLIVNELISNALKYAFKGRKKGKLLLEIKERGDTVTLKVEDDGVGLPPDFRFAEHDSLGVQLVYTLTEQLDGTIDVKSGKGTSITITFEKKT
ncbi:MAG: PAS domain S-box protein [Flavobacteriales bacterium]|nr:PAS domain S-box protein [Flavobacteriales bacterium]